MKKPEEAMEILEAYDLTGSLRGAAALAGREGFYVKSRAELGMIGGKGPEGPPRPDSREMQRGGCGWTRCEAICGHASSGRDMSVASAEAFRGGSGGPRISARFAPGRPAPSRTPPGGALSLGPDGPVLDCAGAGRGQAAKRAGAGWARVRAGSRVMRR